MNYFHVVETKPITREKQLTEIPIWGSECNLPKGYQCLWAKSKVAGSWLYRLLCYFNICKPSRYTIDILYCWEDE